MSFEEDDEVVLHDKHSEYDGQQGTVTQVVETMFGDATYTVSFEDGREQGVPEDSLDPAEEADTDGPEGEDEAGEEAEETGAEETGADGTGADGNEA